MKHLRLFWLIVVTGLSIGVLNVNGQNSNKEPEALSPQARNTVSDTLGKTRTGRQDTTNLGRPNDGNFIEPNKGQKDSVAVEIEKQIDPIRAQIEQVWNSPAGKSWRAEEIAKYENIKHHRIKDTLIREKAQEARQNPRRSPLPSYPGSENSPYFYYEYDPDYRSAQIPLRLSIQEIAVVVKGPLTEDVRAFIESEGLVIPEFGVLSSQAVLRSRKKIGPYNSILLYPQNADDIDDVLSVVARLQTHERIERISPIFYGPEDIESKEPLFFTDLMAVVFQEGTTRAQINVLNKKFGASVIHETRGVYKLRIKERDGISVLQKTEQYRQSPLVLAAQPDIFTSESQANQTSDDPQIGQQWHLDDPQFHNDIDAFKAWRITKGTSLVTMAILDSGVELDHEDLAVNTQNVIHTDALFSQELRPNKGSHPLPNTFLTFGFGSFSQGNYFFNLVDNGHGTMVAGVAGAVNDNGKGVSGVAPNSKVMSVLIAAKPSSTVNTNWWVTKDITAAGIDNALVNGAKVANISYKITDGNQTVFNSAVSNATQQGMVIIKASGNDGDDGEPNQTSPFHDDLIIVGGTNRDGQRRVTSDFDPTLDVVAPGEGILSTDLSNSNWGYDPSAAYATRNGTSYAAPQVAGLAAMLFSIDATFTPQEVRQLIRAGARDQVGNPSEDVAGFDQYHGYGLINAYNTLLLAKSVLANGNFETPPGPMYTITGSLIPNGVTDWVQVIGDFTPVPGDGSGNGGRAGFQSLKVVPDPQALTAIAFTGAGYYPNPGTTLTATAWVKSQPGTRIRMSIGTEDGSNSAGVYTLYENLKDPGDGTGWRPIEVVVQDPGGSTSIWLGVTGGTAYFDMLTVREGYAPLSKIVEGGLETGEDNLVLGWQSDVGSPWEVNNTWPLNNPQHGPQIGLEGSQCMGTHIPETGTGNLISYPFKVTKPYINFKVSGHNGNPTSGTDNRVEFQIKVGNDWLMQDVAYPPGTNDLVQHSWDVSGWIAQEAEARVCVVDGNANGSYAWIGIDDFVLSDTPPSGGGGGGSNVPSPWVSADVGNVGIAGSAVYDNGTFTVNGSGNDIWDHNDGFHYVYQPLSGDGWISAQIVSMDNTNDWAKVGVMIRENTNDNASHAMMVLTPSNGAIIQGRASGGGSSSHPATTSGGTPRWVKIQRSGSTFTGYVSNNSGASWDVVGAMTVSMGSEALMGLCVTSHNNGVLNQTVFNNVNTGSGGGGGGNIVNGNFDNGLTGWTATGPWKINGAWTIENGYPQPGQIGDFAGSFPPESATGTLTSDTFTINKSYINFRIGGQDGANANKVRLIVGGNIVKEVGPPGDNGFVDVSWSVSGWNNQSAHIECVDGNSNGGYAWYCVDEFYLSDTPTTTVTKPVVLAQNTFRSEVPDTFRVNQNTPNPFNPETAIIYELPREVDVSLKVYNALGQEVRSLVNTHMSAGRHTAVWNSKDELGHLVSSGIYFYRFIAGPVDETKKMLILK